MTVTIKKEHEQGFASGGAQGLYELLKALHGNDDLLVTLANELKADLSGHTHAVALDGGTTANESSHTHAVALDSGTTATENAHTHAVALDTGVSAAATLYMSHGVGEVLGSANTDSENADAASLPTNGAYVVNATAVAAGAWTAVVAAQPDCQRNVCIAVTNDSGGPLDLYEGVSTFTVNGAWLNNVQTDTITITSTAGNKTVANGKFRYKYGVKPFENVSSVTVDNAPADGLKLSVGVGSKVGLPCAALLTPAESDVIKITKNHAHVVRTGIVDTTNLTVNLGALADDDSFAIVYRVGHTHGPGTLADAASAAGSAHSHGPGTLADAASGAGSAHSHGPGTLADAASGAGPTISAASAALGTATS